MLIRGFLLLWSAIALLAAPVCAQEPTLVVENGRVIVGDGAVLDRGTVVVAGDRVVAVTEESIEAPDARRIDASGKTVLPGLIDDHVHLTIDPGISDSASVEAFLAEGVDFVKLVSDSLLVPVQISDEQVAAIVDQAHREGLEAVGHVAEPRSMERAADAGLDGSSTRL